MRRTLLLALCTLTMAGGCQLFQPPPEEPVVPPPLQVKAAAPVTPDDVTRANAPAMVQRVRDEIRRDATGELQP